MASNIVDTTIDDTFPVAGVDNDSQGFRDNFNIIKQNFTAARAEITELQANAVLKNKLDSQEALDNNFGGNEVTQALFKNCVDGVFEAGAINNATNISYLNGVYQSGILTQAYVDSGDDITLADWPASGYARMLVELVADLPGVSRVVTFRSEGSYTMKKLTTDPWSATTATSVSIDVNSDSNQTILEFWTNDGGNTIFAKVLGQFE